LLQQAIFNAIQTNKVLFLDYGIYLVTNTIYVPAGARIFGEVWPAITATGSFFQNNTKPQPVSKLEGQENMVL